MSSETFDAVMRSIKDGMTGDSKADMAYLMKVAEEYKDHELGKEILRECGRMAYDIAPDDFHEQLERKIAEDQAEWDELLDETYSLLRDGNVDGACDSILPQAEKLLKLEESGWGTDDTQSSYFEFSCFEEMLLYLNKTRVETEIRVPPAPYSRFYYCAAVCLYEAGRFDEAIEWINRALRWDPASAHLYFELAENYKRKGDIEAVSKTADEAYPFAYTPSLIAQPHRMKGFCEIERGNLELAATYLVGSMVYEQTEMAASELQYMKEELGADYTDMDPEQAFETAEADGAVLGPDDNVIETFMSLIASGQKEGNQEMVSRGAQVMWAITQDESFYELIPPTTVDVEGQMVTLPFEFGELDLERAGLPDYAAFADVGEGYRAIVTVDPIEPDEEPIASFDEAVELARDELEEDEALIELGLDETEEGQQCFWVLAKSPMEDSGMCYHLGMEFGAVALHASFEEGDPTGQRDAVVYEIERQAGNVGNGKDPLVGWSSDPYDPSVSGELLMNLSEQRKYDEVFPEHPLSRARKLVDFVIANN
jgi:tetratricopeptide (TPR) repeat protein